MPSSNGCASGASGSIHASPSRARSSERMNGDAAPMGWKAEQTSWTKPGRVSSAERHPPPIVSFASYTVTERPLRASSIAAASPFGPAPTTIASTTPGRGYERPLWRSNQSSVRRSASMRFGSFAKPCPSSS